MRRMSDIDDVVRRRAANNLQMNAAAAIGLGVLQFCCNPFLITTFMAAGASMNAIQQPKWLAISLEEDYPMHAGTVSRVGGVIGLVLCALQLGLVALRIFVIGYTIS